MPVAIDDAKDTIKQLNSNPFYVGQTPSYVSNYPSFQGGVCRLSAYSHALSAEEVHRLAAYSPPENAAPVEDGQCLDILAILQNCVENFDFPQHEDYSSADDNSGLCEQILKPLLQLIIWGPALTKIASLKLGAVIVPKFPPLVVDSLLASLLGDNGEGLLSFLFNYIGDFLNVWLRFTRGKDIAEADFCEDFRYDVVMVQVDLIKELLKEKIWRDAISASFTKTVSDVSDTLALLRESCAGEIAGNKSGHHRYVVLGENLDTKLSRLHAILALIGGVVDGIFPGAKGGYLKSDNSAEECTIIAPSWAPSEKDLEQSTNPEVSWTNSKAYFGASVVISLASNPKKFLLVPSESVVTYNGPASPVEISFFEENKNSITDLLHQLVTLDVSDPRPVYKPIIKESDSVLTFDSPHPYNSNMDTYKEVSMPGAKEIVITFDQQSRTENNCDYLKFYKDNTKGSHWGQEKYSGRNNDYNWPGVGGKPSLTIPAESFV